MQRSRTPLARVKNLAAFGESSIPESFLDEDLPALGISSAEDFLGLLRSDPQALAKETGTSLVALEALYREVLEELVPAEEWSRFQERPAGPEIFGAAPAGWIGEPEVTAENLSTAAARELPESETLTTDVSLTDGCMPEARDQGRRPTCTAFAAVGVLEYLLCRFSGTRVDLSEQYLYWLLFRNGVLDMDGRALLSHVFEIARTHGVCREELWNYSGENHGGDLTHGDPRDPEACQADAGLHRFDTVRSVTNPREVGAIRQILGRNQPVAVTVPLFPAFSEEPFYSDGRITLPLVHTTPTDHHTMVLVGYLAAPKEPGGGVFLVRNSLGRAWGIDSGQEPGHGTISVTYIQKLAEEAWTGTV